MLLHLTARPLYPETFQHPRSYCAAKMGKIEELPDDFDESLNLNPPLPPPSDLPNGPGPTGVPSLESLIHNATQSKSSPAAAEPSDGTASAPKPPAMTETMSKTADELLAELNRTPLFMTSLDDTDGQGGENAALEGLKALAYEGTKAEVAGNFREQGNECARMKQWFDAREFYNKALAVLRGPARPQDNVDDDDEPDMNLGDDQELDPEEEARKERQIEEASLVNRALCNLEMSTSDLLAAQRRMYQTHSLRGNATAVQAQVFCCGFDRGSDRTLRVQTLKQSNDPLIIHRDLRLIALLSRKLSFLHSGLQGYTPRQSFERQGMVPQRHRLSCSRQNCRSGRFL